MESGTEILVSELIRNEVLQIANQKAEEMVTIFCLIV
jgi:hypothetical protein